MIPAHIKQLVRTYKSRKVSHQLGGVRLALCNILTGGLFSRLYMEAVLAENALNGLELCMPIDEPESEPGDDIEEERSEELHFASRELSFSAWVIQFRSLSGAYFLQSAELVEYYDDGLTPAEAAAAYKENLRREHHRRQQLNSDD